MSVNSTEPETTGENENQKSTWYIVIFALLFVILRDLANPVAVRVNDSNPTSRLVNSLNSQDVIVTNNRLEFLESSSFLQKGPKLKFLYCYSCGYKNAYLRLSEKVMEKYPEMVVDGDNYLAHPLRRATAYTLGVSKFILMLCIFTDVNPFKFVGLGFSPFFRRGWIWMRGNKIFASLMFIFVSNFFEGLLLSTGAFEIFLNDVQVWSKLQSGRMPSGMELQHILGNELNLFSMNSEIPV